MDYSRLSRIARAQVTHSISGATESFKEFFVGCGENVTSSIRVDMSRGKELVADWFLCKYGKELRISDVIEKYQSMPEPKSQKEQLQRRMDMLTELRSVGAFDGALFNLSTDEVVKHYIDMVGHIRYARTQMFLLVEKKINQKYPNKFLNGASQNTVDF